MKLLDIFADRVLEMPLFEMAMRRKDAIRKVSELEHKINEHIIKSLIFNSQAQNHWYSELDSWLYKINELEIKPNNDNLSFEILFQELFNNYYDHGTTSLKKQVVRYLKDVNYATEARTNISLDDIWNKLKIIHTKLCKDLSIGSLHSKGSQHYIELVK